MAVDYFLKLDGIPGDSTDAKHKGEIDVVAFSWGVARPGSPAPGGGGGGAGKAIFEDLLVVARASKASPKLWQACATGQHLKTAVLVCRKAGKAPVEFLKITLKEVTITSYEIEGSDEELPLDQVALAFDKIETEFVSVDAKGTAQPPIKTGWDLKKNAKV